MLKAALSQVNSRSLRLQFNAIRALSSAHSTGSNKYDVTIVGGGIVGLATARELLLQYPNLKFCVLEKEHRLSIHQTGHNSGVIHAGIYYTPGTLKAKLCVEGLKLMYKYCDEHGVPYKKAGKLIVATEQEEIPRLDKLYSRAQENGCKVEIIDGSEIQSIEPHCRGLKAIHSPETGIVDFGLVARTYGKEFEQKGGDIKLAFEVQDFKQNSDPKYPVVLTGNHEYQEVQSRFVIVCGGLYSDRLAAKSNCDQIPKIVPFRGEYLILKPEKTYLAKGNIYPVPNPALPFLGFHFTPRMNGDVWLGPNALLAFKREGYKFFDFNLRDSIDAITFSGLRKLVFKNLSAGFGEIYRSMMVGAQVKQLQRFIPELSVKDVMRGPAGVRAQALDTDGNLVDDFIFDSGHGSFGKRMLHVRNAPSPAATSSLAIARMIADEVKTRFEL
ncbi:L-2-hydroxyglutarate dehydrogenase, mitochondrial-like [Styela clava]